MQKLSGIIVVVAAVLLVVEAAVASDRMLAEPRPTVWLMAFGESSSTTKSSHG